MSMIANLCTRIQSLSLLKPQINTAITTAVRYRKPNIPRKRYPFWYTKQHRVLYKDNISPENKEFIDEIVEEKYGKATEVLSEANYESPLKVAPIEPKTGEWTPESKRCGLIAKKIGIYPMWMKDGKKVYTTLLQIIDNHVIKYTPAEKHFPRRQFRSVIKRKLGCLVVGAESADPQNFTKEYCGLFNDSGVMPKRHLCRFLVTPEAAIQPGTRLHAAHFKPGDVIDIRGKTTYRGFQGVMKRWGFHGMPATHGVTKTHRRPGNIGSGSRGVIKGTKMAGHMGNKYRVIRGYKILRINTKYNVIWIKGLSVPGETNNYVQIYDSVIRSKLHKTPPHFPTYLPQPGEKLPEELFVEDLHMFNDPTILHPTEEKK